MYAKVKVIMKNHKAHAVQGSYTANGHTVTLMNKIEAGQEARFVRASQWEEAEKRLGLVA